MEKNMKILVFPVLAAGLGAGLPAQISRREKATYSPVTFALVAPSGPYFTDRKSISGGSFGGVWGPSAHYNKSYRYLKW